MTTLSRGTWPKWKSWRGSIWKDKPSSRKSQRKSWRQRFVLTVGTLTQWFKKFQKWLAKYKSAAKQCIFLFMKKSSDFAGKDKTQPIIGSVSESKTKRVHLWVESLVSFAGDFEDPQKRVAVDKHFRKYKPCLFYCSGFASASCLHTTQFEAIHFDSEQRGRSDNEHQIFIETEQRAQWDHAEERRRHVQDCQKMVHPPILLESVHQRGCPRSSYQWFKIQTGEVLVQSTERKAGQIQTESFWKKVQFHS